MTKTAATSASPTRRRVGCGIFSPRATKNSVMKKSRTPVSRAVTSVPYGKPAITMPAISAPISLESPTPPATPATRKHHAIAVRSTSSVDRAMLRKSAGSA